MINRPPRNRAFSWCWLLANAMTILIAVGCSHIKMRTIYTDANGTSVSNEFSLHYDIPTNSLERAVRLESQSVPIIPP